jgi:hypothetical protein
MRYLGLCAAVAAVLVAGSARAQAQDQTNDLRCVALFAAMLGNPQFAQLKESSSAGLFYFLGRAEGRQPKMDLAAQLSRVREDLPITQYEDETRRCFAALKRKNEELKAMGDAQQGKR